MSLTIEENFNSISIEDLKSQPGAHLLNFSEIIDLLKSPDKNELLTFDSVTNQLSDSSNMYPIVDGLPILYPNDLIHHFLNNGLDLNYFSDPKLQYFLLSQIKQRGEINAPSSSIHYQRHLYRMQEMVKDLNGLVLDIGCDDVSIGASLFSNKCKYIGIDPFSSNNSLFKVVGVGESLPFKDESFDVAVFNTSLDHILDYHLAIDEAFRVLKKDGILIISTLIWISDASLLNDSVHFHHFRDFEIQGALLTRGEIVKIQNYKYKEETKRYGMFISARKN